MNTEMTLEILNKFGFGAHARVSYSWHQPTSVIRHSQKVDEVRFGYPIQHCCCYKIRISDKIKNTRAMFGKQTNKVYGVGLYLLAVWVLYGRREILPKSILKSKEVKEALEVKKRDPKVAIQWRSTIDTGGKSVYAYGQQLKGSESD